MSIFEYDKEKEEKKLRKAEFEAGMEEGIAKGIEKGIKKGIAKGIEKGIEEERLNSIRNMIDIGISKEIILGRYSKEEYEKAVNH